MQKMLTPYVEWSHTAKILIKKKTTCYRFPVLKNGYSTYASVPSCYINVKILNCSGKVRVKYDKSDVLYSNGWGRQKQNSCDFQNTVLKHLRSRR